MARPTQYCRFCKEEGRGNVKLRDPHPDTLEEINNVRVVCRQRVCHVCGGVQEETEKTFIAYRKGSKPPSSGLPVQMHLPLLFQPWDG